MTVLGAAKVPFFNRDTLAAMLELASTSVDLIENNVGGGFGARGEFGSGANGAVRSASLIYRTS